MIDLQRRSSAIDMAKGIAIVLVVYGHCLRGLVAAGTLPDGPAFAVPDYVIYTFHMPLFFVTAGFFYLNAEKRGGRHFWISRLETIAYPYFLWSIIQGLVQIALSGSSATNNGLGWSGLLAIAWSPISPFWFLYALFFSYVFAHLTRHLPRAVLLGAATLGFVLAFVTIGGVIEDIFYGLLYFSLGMLARDHGWLGRLVPRWPAVAAWAVAFLLLALGCLALGVPERLPFPAALAGIAATLVLCLAIEQRHPGSLAVPILAALGRYSMGIYVMHILVLGFVRTVVLRVLHLNNPWLIVAAALPTALVLPMAAQHMLVRWRLNRIAGLPFSATRKTASAVHLPA